jgi:flagellar motility protein MotE (MotC chaperone)
MSTQPVEFEVKPDAIVITPPSAMTPVELLRMAVSQNADIEKLKQLMDLQERWAATEARKAYNAAMRQFKSNPPTIQKNHEVKFGTTKYSHATLDHVCDVVTKGLSAVGITHAWKVRQGEVITVVCILTHELGHSEETEMSGVADNSGSKNSIQAIGSTVTYLQRYTLLAACGLAAKNDDDAQTAGKPFIEASEIEKNCREIANAADMPTLKFLFTVALDKARDLSDRKAMAYYIEANDKRKKELGYATR